MVSVGKFHSLQSDLHCTDIFNSLAKDDMMMDADYEVRIPLPGEERAWVTDLDVQTLRRAEGFLNATEEEKGPWVAETDEELERLMQ